MMPDDPALSCDNQAVNLRPYPEGAREPIRRRTRTLDDEILSPDPRGGKALTAIATVTSEKLPQPVSREVTLPITFSGDTATLGPVDLLIEAGNTRARVSAEPAIARFDEGTGHITGLVLTFKARLQGLGPAAMEGRTELGTDLARGGKPLDPADGSLVLTGPVSVMANLPFGRTVSIAGGMLVLEGTVDGIPDPPAR